MKLSYLLINLVLVGGGIFAYDQLRAPDPAGNPDTDYDELRADGPTEPGPQPEPMRAGGSSGMRGSYDKATIRALEDRLASLERIVSRMPRTTSDGKVLPTGGKLPTLTENDLVNPDDPAFDERTVQTIEAYMDEIQRRKAAERQRQRVGGELDRLGMELTEEQKKNVIEETLKYQAKARDILRRPFPRDEAGRTARQEAFKEIQEEFATTIKRLVPADAAEKISNSRIGRGLGYYGRNAGRNLGGRNRPGGRRGGDR